jgi:aryl-alcohol dehydrogenase-like predicted oxidoreductase
VGIGTWAHGGPREAGGRAVGWSGHDDAASRDALVAAWEHGLTHWDTADVYGDGHAERLIGSAWGPVPRDQVFLATKVGWDPGPHDHYYHPAHIRQQLEASLARLATDVIDLYYLHHCDFGPGDRHFAAAARVLQDARRDGKVRYLGLSDWDAGKIARFAPLLDPDVVQPYRNVVDDDYRASGLAAWVEASGAGVAFFSPLKHGLLLGKHPRPVRFPPGDFRRNIPEFEDPEALARFAAARRALEKRYRDHPQPVLHGLLGTLLSDAPQAAVLLGVRNRQQLAAAATVGAPLSPAEAAWVRNLYRPTLG